MFRSGARGKSGFLTRLSSLILIQVAFVLSGLALVIYLPGDSRHPEKIISGLIRELETASDDLGRASVDPQSPIPETSMLSALMNAGGERQTFTGIVVYSVDSTGSPCVARAIGEDTEDCLWAVCLSPGRHGEHLSQLLALPAGFGATAVRGDGHIVHQYRVDLADGRPVLVAGVLPHGFDFSDGSDPTTVLLLLFGASTFISILIVLMIRRRFQWPLNRLLRGLEKTADGELFVMAENFDDAELDKLATAFNVMSRRLWNNHQELTRYNRRLKKLNISLLESQLFFSTLVESSPLCIVVTSPTGQILLFNRQACDDFGYRSSDAVGKNVNELFAGSASSAHIRLEVSADGSQFESRCRRRGGDYFPAYVISRPARGRDGKIAAYIYIIKDITESRGFQDMMVRLDRYYTRGEMAGDIAHEINNYLSILLGNLELLPIVLRSGDESKIERKLGIMRDTADRIARFTDGLLDGPQDEANFETCDLNQLVANVLAFLRPQNKFDDIHLGSELSADLPLVYVDSSRIQQLLVNFIYNAADAVGEVLGERLITVRTEVVQGTSTPFARVEVIDNGPGVVEDKQALLFHRRFTTKRKGHGIGLITCRKIAELHGGRIGYHFRNGAIFSCEVPVKPVRSGEPAVARAECAESSDTSTGTHGVHLHS